MLLETASEPSGGQEACCPGRPHAQRTQPPKGRHERRDEEHKEHKERRQPAAAPEIARAEPTDTTPTDVTGTTVMRSGARFVRSFCCSSARHGQNKGQSAPDVPAPACFRFLSVWPQPARTGQHGGKRFCAAHVRCVRRTSLAARRRLIGGEKHRPILAYHEQ
ncbi:hypothetical protein BYI23_A007370 [Burkholderia sp. YI23]|nr:hypothetical protein BYI23_A007370 [Burkholderia sp. YI23]